MTSLEARAVIARLNEECKTRTQAIWDVANAEVEAVFAEYAPLLRPLWRVVYEEQEMRTAP